MAVSFQKTIPLLRIFDVDKAKEFYVGYLGFSLDWEHHFEENTPAYLQVSRDGLVLHLAGPSRRRPYFSWIVSGTVRFTILVRSNHSARRPSAGTW
jgi:catechol 2,3-dioxygenase-like lactoylglutathione lyase family enzyme